MGGKAEAGEDGKKGVREDEETSASVSVASLVTGTKRGSCSAEGAKASCHSPLVEVSARDELASRRGGRAEGHQARREYTARRAEGGTSDPQAAPDWRWRWRWLQQQWGRRRRRQQAAASSSSSSGKPGFFLSLYIPSRLPASRAAALSTLGYFQSADDLVPHTLNARRTRPRSRQLC